MRHLLFPLQLLLFAALGLLVAQRLVRDAKVRAAAPPAPVHRWEHRDRVGDNVLERNPLTGETRWITSPLEKR